MASALPKGSEERRAILAGLKRASDAADAALELIQSRSKRYPWTLDELDRSLSRKGVNITRKDMERLVSQGKLVGLGFQGQPNGRFALPGTPAAKEASEKTFPSEDDKTVLLRFASSLPKGSEERRAILARLKEGSEGKRRHKLRSDAKKAERLS
jgi:hypothetical protein